LLENKIYKTYNWNDLDVMKGEQKITNEQMLNRNQMAHYVKEEDCKVKQKRYTNRWKEWRKSADRCSWENRLCHRHLRGGGGSSFKYKIFGPLKQGVLKVCGRKCVQS
jgi:hypothetical protein